MLGETFENWHVLPGAGVHRVCTVVWFCQIQKCSYLFLLAIYSCMCSKQ